MPAIAADTKTAASSTPIRAGKSFVAVRVGLLSLCWLVAGLYAPALGQPGPPATPTPSPQPTFSLPSDFAPLPGFPQYSRNALQKQLSAVLRTFEVVAAAEVVITGEEGKNLAAKVLIKRRPGAALQRDLILSVVQMVEDTMPGLARDRIFIADSAGHPLYVAGQVQPVATAAASSASSLGWLLLGVVGLAVAAVLAVVWRWRRLPEAGPEAGGLAFLSSLKDEGLAAVLAGERAEMLSVLCVVGGPVVAKRLRRYALRRHLPLPGTARTIDSEVGKALAASLRRKALGAGLAVRE